MPIPITLNEKDLEQLIISSIPRDVLMALEDAYKTGDEQGRNHAALFLQGHRRSAAGHSKHFCTNERFYEVLQVHGANPAPLRGTRLVTAPFGIFNIARLNVPGHQWVNLRRSTTRKKLAEVNRNIEKKYVQGDLFSEAHEVAEGTIFILGVMDGMDSNGMTQLTQVKIALPAPDMKSWLYIKPIKDFLKLYDQVGTTTQPDGAIPQLKTQPKKQTGNDQGN